MIHILVGRTSHPTCHGVYRLYYQTHRHKTWQLQIHSWFAGNNFAPSLQTSKISSCCTIFKFTIRQISDNLKCNFENIFIRHNYLNNLVLHQVVSTDIIYHENWCFPINYHWSLVFRSVKKIVFRSVSKSSTAMQILKVCFKMSSSGFFSKT